MLTSFHVSSCSRRLQSLEALCSDILPDDCRWVVMIERPETLSFPYLCSSEICVAVRIVLMCIVLMQLRRLL